MKRILTVILAAVLLLCAALTAASCGNIDYDRFDVDDFIANAESDGIIRVPVYGEKEGTKVTIMQAAPFSEGVALIYIHEEAVKDGYKTLKQYTVAVNTAGKIIHTFNVFSYANLMMEPHQNGVALDTKAHSLYDTNLEVIASPDKTGYDCILAAVYDRGLFLVAKTEEKFEGDVILVGIINNKGEYVEPLSTDHIIAKTMNENGLKLSKYRFEVVGDGVISIYPNSTYVSERDVRYYHLLTDKITAEFDHYEVYDKMLLQYFEDPEKEYETVINKPDYVEAIINGRYILVRSVDPDTQAATFSLLNQDLTKVMDFGSHKLVAQPRSAEESSFHYTNGYFLTQVENSTGGLYCCLYTPSGELAFEPIRMDKNDHFYALSEAGFVFRKSNEQDFYFVDYQGNMTAFDSTYNFTAGTSEFSNGLACVSSSKGWVYINTKGEVIISGETLAKQLAK